MSDAWTIVSAVATAFAAIAAAVAARASLRQIQQVGQTFNNELFSKILEELATDVARRDRATLARHFNWKPSDASMVEKLTMAQNNFEKDSQVLQSPEMALDRTIPRLDRVGYFLLGDRKELELVMKPPPAWLWVMVEKTWGKSDDWIKYRRSPEHPDFHDEYYGRYFQKLHLYYEKKKDVLKAYYAESDKSYFFGN